MSVRFGAFVFHAERRQLLHDGAEVHLTPKAFDLLGLLIRGRRPSFRRRRSTSSSGPTRSCPMRRWQDWSKKCAARWATMVPVRSFGRPTGWVSRLRRQQIASGSPNPTAITHWLTVGTRRIPLKDGVNVIGRDPDATVWLDVPGVSRRHAQVIVKDGVATLEDLGSKNGTLVGDRPVRGQVTLRHADRIQVATELLVLHVSNRGMSTATQAVLPPSTESDRD